jgi:hypothetical protein
MQWIIFRERFLQKIWKKRPTHRLSDGAKLVAHIPYYPLNPPHVSDVVDVGVITPLHIIAICGVILFPPPYCFPHHMYYITIGIQFVYSMMIAHHALLLT